MVGAVGFEPTTPGPKPGALPGCAMLRSISAFAVSHIVRYGVHSRRDALRRQHLLSKVKNPYQMYI